VKTPVPTMLDTTSAIACLVPSGRSSSTVRLYNDRPRRGKRRSRYAARVSSSPSPSSRLPAGPVDVEIRAVMSRLEDERRAERKALPGKTK
jgi:hypothetical protein